MLLFLLLSLSLSTSSILSFQQPWEVAVTPTSIVHLKSLSGIRNLPVTKWRRRKDLKPGLGAQWQDLSPASKERCLLPPGRMESYFLIYVSYTSF